MNLEINDKEKIIQDFRELILHMDVNTPNEINDKITDIIKRVRKLYIAGREEDD